jgi:hypothetical protein
MAFVKAQVDLAYGFVKSHHEFYGWVRKVVALCAMPTLGAMKLRRRWAPDFVAG